MGPGWHFPPTNDVIMSAMASQITSLTIVYSTVYSGGDQRKHQNSASLAFVWGFHRWPVNFPDEGSVTRRMFPFDDVIMWFSWDLIFAERNNIRTLRCTLCSILGSTFESVMRSCRIIYDTDYSATHRPWKYNHSIACLVEHWNVLQVPLQKASYLKLLRNLETLRLCIRIIMLHSNLACHGLAYYQGYMRISKPVGAWRICEMIYR